MPEVVWELSYREPGRREVSRHNARGDAITALAGHLVDAGVTILSDPTAADRNAEAGDFSTTLTAPDGTRISYAVRSIKLPSVYLNRAQVEEELGLASGSLSKIKMPEPDVVVGPVNGDGTIPRGTVRGWLPETIDAWERPGRGARTDLGERQ